MRIIGGKYGGRKLVSFQASHIRPTTDRVKETLFNILQDEFIEKRVLDLFAGTGNVSFEFLSRGAKEVVAVESHSKSLQIIKKNQDLLGEKNIKTIKENVFSFLKKAQLDYSHIFIDPPFTEKLGHEVMDALSKAKNFNPDVKVVIETSKFERLELAYGEYQCYDQRKFGDKTLSFYRLQE